MYETSIKYSIVIPVYNSEKTLERCLNSLLSQNRIDIEIIAVNDGSTDRSWILLESYKKIYNCLKVVNQSNGGVSQARNIGIETATGDYILFVDSDDYVSEEYFNKLDSFGDEDLCVFARQNIGSKQTDSSFFDSIDSKATFSKKLEQLTIGRKMLPPWNKRFKKSIIQNNQIRFIEDFQIGEDFDFCMNYVMNCSSIQVSNKAIYYLDVSNQNSLSRKYRPLLNKKLKAVYLHIENMFAVYNNSNINQKRLLAVIDYLYVRNVITCILEELKKSKSHYFWDRGKYKAICKDYQIVIGKTELYVNVIHKVIRLLLRMNMVFPFYLISYLIKWKQAV